MTARKTTPHLKRGPKPKPKPKPPQPPKRKVGRPEMPLRVQPYRYMLAYYEALATMGHLGRRRAAVWLEAMYKGPITVNVAEHGTKYGVSLSVKLTEAIDLEEFAKDCDSLRALAKWHAAKPDDLAWLMTMGEAARIAGGPWHPDAIDIVLRLAALANEVAWARKVLLPMLRKGEPVIPELADNFSPT
jgi:hypothetical protein